VRLVKSCHANRPVGLMTKKLLKKAD